MTAPNDLTPVTESWLGRPPETPGAAVPPAVVSGPTPPAGGESRVEQGSVDTLRRPEYHLHLALSFTVTGRPKPKGSLRHVGHGRLIDQVKGTVEWGAEVEGAARQMWGRAAAIEGPVLVELVVTVPALKKPRRWPITRSSGDTDKHQRNVGDAIQKALVVKDDSQIVRWEAEKTYPGQHPDVLDKPGAVIRIWTIGGVS